MNDDLERRLRSQHLRAPSRALDERVAQALRGGGRRFEPSIAGRVLRWGVPLGVGAAALVTIAAVWLFYGNGEGSGGIGARSVTSLSLPDGGVARRDGEDESGGPVRIESVVSGYSPARLVWIDDEPMRSHIGRGFRRVEWIDPDGDVRMEVTVPHRRVRLTSAPMD